MKKLSVIVPFYNEEKVLAKNVSLLYDYLTNRIKDFELILVDDGSVDASGEIAQAFVRKHPTITLLTVKVNTGRGNAIRLGLQKAKGKIRGYLDADLEIKKEYIPVALELLTTSDIVIASKFAKGAKTEAPITRKVSSFLFNLLVRAVLRSGLSDHQAGFKFFRAEASTALVGLSEQNGWLWDIEILYLAKKKNYTIKELPITLRYGYRNIRSTFIFDFLKMPLFVFALKQKVDERTYHDKK